MVCSGRIGCVWIGYVELSILSLAMFRSAMLCSVGFSRVELGICSKICKKESKYSWKITPSVLVFCLYRDNINESGNRFLDLFR